MHRFIIGVILVATLLGCQKAMEAIPRTTVLLVVGEAGPSLTILQNNLPEGAEVNLPQEWDTLSVQTAMGVVVVDAETDTSALFTVASHTLLYDTTTGLYLALDSTGIPSWLQLDPGDPVEVISSQDTATGQLPETPEIIITQVPDSVGVGQDITVSWSYSSGEPDSVMVDLSLGGQRVFSETYPGSTTSATIPGSEVDTSGAGIITITGYTLSVGALEGATPLSTVIFSRSEAAYVNVSQ